MTDKINGTGSGNANYVQQDNNQIQNENTNPEIRNAQKSGSKLGLAVKIVATILTGGLFGIGWGIYSLVHRANKSPNTAPLNQNNTGVPGEKRINNDIINTTKTDKVNTSIKEPEDIDELDDGDLPEPKKDSVRKFQSGADFKIPGEFDGTKVIYGWENLDITEDKKAYGKKDGFLEFGIKGSALEKPVSKMINDFIKFAGKDKVNKIISTVLPNADIDVNKLSDNEKKSIIMKCAISQYASDSYSNIYVDNYMDKSLNKGFLAILEYGFNSLLNRVDEDLSDEERKELMTKMATELRDEQEVEEEENVQEDDNIIHDNDELADNELDEEQNIKINKNVNSSKIDYEEYEQMDEFIIKPSKYLGHLDTTGYATFKAIMTEDVKKTLINIKNQGNNAVGIVKSYFDKADKDLPSLDNRVMVQARKIYNRLMSVLDYDHKPVQVALKNNGYKPSSDEAADFCTLLISKAIQNPKNEKFFAEDSDEELHVIDFLKLMNDEVDALLYEGNK